MMHRPKNCTALILAAGTSSRMGFPKAFLKWNDTFFFLEKLINEYLEFSCKEIIVVVNNELVDYYNSSGMTFLGRTQVVINDFPELPRLLSVKLGLQKVTSSFCFLQNIDNPFTDQELLTQLYLVRTQIGYVAPVVHGKSGHPILMGSDIYNGILPVHDNTVILSDVLKKYERVSVPATNENFLCNINTPDEYNKYFKHISK